MINVFCDGSITGSHWAKKANRDSLPHSWSGWYAQTEDGQHLHHNSLDLGEDKRWSANVSEYMAVVSALRWLRQNHPFEHLKIHSDSQVVMFQLSGAYTCHNPLLRKFYEECRHLAGTFKSISYNWIPRRDNFLADILSKGWQLWNRVPTWQEVLDYSVEKKVRDLTQPSSSAIVI